MGPTGGDGRGVRSILNISALQVVLVFVGRCWPHKAVIEAAGRINMTKACPKVFFIARFGLHAYTRHHESVVKLS